ncbi:MAG: hypothetical protein KA341_12025 [Saprospiraceae bacterium]|nr:hypothetical protein [Saprospiraceae bacterium]
MKSSWTEIMSSALLGTDKRPLNIHVLPEDIRSELLAMGQDTAESTLLKAAAIHHFYNRSGTLPDKLENTGYRQITETKSFIDTATINVFLRITETGYYEKEYLLRLWLDKVIGQNKIAAPNIILPIINLGIGFSKNTRKKIMAVLGERAKAILPLKPDFKAKELQSNITDQWKEGNPEERRTFISELRTKDADQSLSLIQSDWPTETIVFKRTIIEILSEQTQPADYLFLTTLYENEFAAKPKEKKTEVECRALLAKVLLKDTNSNIFRSTVAEMQKYIGQEKKSGIMGLLTGGKDKVIHLPTVVDTFFNVENMVNIYGIDPKNPDPALYKSDVIYWFSALLAIMPLDIMTSLLEKSKKETFEYLLNNTEFKAKIEGKDVSVFLNALSENVKNYRDQELLQMILQFDTHDRKYLLLQYSETKVFEEYVIKEKLFLEALVITHHPANYEDWSPYFSVKMVEATYKSFVVDKKHYYEKINQLMAKHLHISTLSRLEEMYQSAASDHFKEYWIKNVYQPVKTSIEIKTSISNL